jgi:alpha-tubulin suppressor-like RCC1 family protein
MGERLPFVDLAAATLSLAAGADHSCALLVGGEVKCWGANGLGQLGVGDQRDRVAATDEMGSELPALELPAAHPMGLSAGDYHTCARFADETVYCWGHNRAGQLGTGDGQPRGAIEPSRDATPTPVDFGAERRARFVTSGASHNCAVLDDRSLKCWGLDLFGSLGRGGGADRVGDEAKELGDGWPTVMLSNGPTPVSAVSAGTGFTCAVLDESRVKCWGQNNQGQLGIGDTEDRGDNPSEM